MLVSTIWKVKERITKKGQNQKRGKTETQRERKQGYITQHENILFTLKTKQNKQTTQKAQQTQILNESLPHVTNTMFMKSKTALPPKHTHTHTHKHTHETLSENMHNLQSVFKAMEP